MIQITSRKVYIKNLQFHAYIGVGAQEQIVGNDYIVSLAIDYPFEAAMVSDDVEDTINYATVYQVVAEVMAQKAQLLESVAYQIAQQVIERYPLTEALDVDVMKQNPPMGAECAGAGVQIHVINQKTDSKQ